MCTTALTATSATRAVAEDSRESPEKTSKFLTGPPVDKIVFVVGVTLGLLITDEPAAPIPGTIDVDVIAETLTYADYVDFSDCLRRAGGTEDKGESLSHAGRTTAL